MLDLDVPGEGGCNDNLFRQGGQIIEGDIVYIWLSLVFFYDNIIIAFNACIKGVFNCYFGLCHIMKMC